MKTGIGGEKERCQKEGRKKKEESNIYDMARKSTGEDIKG